LVFLRKRAAESSVSPSYDEMKEALGLASKAGVHRMLVALEERGFVKRLPHRARSVVLSEAA
jgi:repressor LexA